MLELNLTNEEKSQVKYKISKFPDGQQAITLSSFEQPILGRGILIKSRMNDFKDLEIIICAVEAIREIAIQTDSIIPIHLYVGSFLGARSDRKFSIGSSNYLKTVITPIINSLELSSITVWDPHSDVLEALLNGFKKITNEILVSFALTDINPVTIPGNSLNIFSIDDVYLVSPDAGANKKVHDIAKAIGYNKPIIEASKHREVQTGDILETRVPGIDETPGKKKFVILDDICDGGRTFTELAKAIRKIRPLSIFGDEIYLVVTHGIFSAGFRNLSPIFNGIYCTNSVKDVEEIVLEEFIGSDGTVESELVTTKVKQLNIFY